MGSAGLASLYWAGIPEPNNPQSLTLGRGDSATLAYQRATAETGGPILYRLRFEYPSGVVNLYDLTCN